MEFVMDKRKGKSKVVLGDCLDLIPKHLEENSVHAVVTDPPY